MGKIHEKSILDKCQKVQSNRDMYFLDINNKSINIFLFMQQPLFLFVTSALIAATRYKPTPVSWMINFEKSAAMIFNAAKVISFSLSEMGTITMSNAPLCAFSH